MGATHLLPQPLSSACEARHPLELWILVNGEIVQCTGRLLPADPKARIHVTTSLPEGFVGVMRTGAAVRGFFTDAEGSVHTFLTSIHQWSPYRDRATSALVVLDPPSLVAPCQRRRGDRRSLPGLRVRLAVTIRGEREQVPGRLVDISPSGLGVRVIRNDRGWFPEGARVEVEVDVPGRTDPVVLGASIARVTAQALHYLYGLRADSAGGGRRALADILDRVAS